MRKKINKNFKGKLKNSDNFFLHIAVHACDAFSIAFGWKSSREMYGSILATTCSGIYYRAKKKNKNQ